MVMFFIRAKRAAIEEARRRAGSTEPALTPQYRDRFDRAPVIEWAAVISQLFFLSLFSGSFLLLFVWAVKSWSSHWQ
jgi:hypothetical protein